MHGPRTVLNELRWHHEALDQAIVHYIHRGAPNDHGILEGTTIEELGRSFITVRTPEGAGKIPYHRVFRIDRGEETVWTREEMHEEHGAPEGEHTGTRADREA